MFIFKKIRHTHTLKKIILQRNCFSDVADNVVDPIVCTKQGKLRGAVKKLWDGKDYYSFKGIPYGQPTDGELRFQAPLPAKPWSGTRDALKHGPVCPQYDVYTSSYIQGSEDCLYLNVYTKSLAPSSKLPVMVFLHGGAYASGSGNSGTYGPEYLCQQDVILVTLNYRLEALGFLCTDTKDAPGNAGLKDQVLALKWVKENIEMFGGDSNNITLFGESAGSSSAMYHMFSPMSRGLFDKVLAQSGTCIQDWAVGTEPRARALRVGKHLGIDTKDPAELMKYLRNLPAIKLCRVTIPSRTEDEKYRSLPIQFIPVIEKDLENVDNFITEDPLDLLFAEKVAKVPFILGYTTAEGMLFLSDTMNKAHIVNSQPSYILSKEVAGKLNENQRNELGAELKRFYFGARDIGDDTQQEIVDMLTDKLFAYNTHRFAYFYSQINKPTYLYKFDLDTDLNIVKRLLGYTHLQGVCHTDDLQYEFCGKMTRDMYETEENIRNAIHKVVKLWTDFAKTGNPTPPSSECIWRPHTPSGGEYLYIGDQMKNCDQSADKARLAVWNKTYAAAGLPSIEI